MSATTATGHHELAPAARRREGAAFRLAMALILLAVADDAFVHPEPGTAVADHLASPSST